MTTDDYLDDVLDKVLDLYSQGMDRQAEELLDKANIDTSKMTDLKNIPYHEFFYDEGYKE